MLSVVRRFRLAQLVVFGAFVVFVCAAMVRMSQMIDYDEAWHGPISNYTPLVEHYPIINILAAVMGLSLVVATLAVVVAAAAWATRRWRASLMPTRVAAAALGVAGLGLGGWGLALVVLTGDREWSAPTGVLAAGTAIIAATHGDFSARRG